MSDTSHHTNPISIHRVDHVGIVVDDLDSALAFAEGVLGITTIDRVERAGVRAVFCKCGNIDLEIVEFTDPVQRAARLGEAAARLDHLALEVSDLDASYTQLAQHGVEMKGPAKQTNRYRTFWTEPASSAGLLLQVVDRGLKNQPD